VFLHSLGPGDTLPDAEAVIFSILPILAILSCSCSCRLPFPIGLGGLENCLSSSVPAWPKSRATQGPPCARCSGSEARNA